MQKRHLFRFFIIFLISIFFIFTMKPYSQAFDVKIFPDLPANHWAINSIKVVTEKGIIAGYTNGKFGPEDKVTAAQYIRMVIVALGYKELPVDKKYWAQPSINKAIELGLVKTGELSDYEKPIARKDMARIAIRTMDINHEVYPEYVKAFWSTMADFTTIPDTYKLDICKCVCKGVLSGYPNGKFQPEDFLTRAQAASVLHRIVVPAEREKSKIAFATPDLEFEAFMASPEAVKYAAIGQTITRVKDGAVFFVPHQVQGAYSDALPNADYNPEVNKVIYNTLKLLVNQARKNNRYVVAFYTPDMNSVDVRYRWDTITNSDKVYTAGFNIESILYTAKPAEWDSFLSMKGDILYAVGIPALYDGWQSPDGKNQQEFCDALLEMCKGLYGDGTGKKLGAYFELEYDNTRTLDDYGKISVQTTSETGTIELGTYIKVNEGYPKFITSK